MTLCIFAAMTGCKEKIAIDGTIVGIWQSHSDSGLPGELSNAKMTETIAFDCQNSIGVGGDFVQFFTGTMQEGTAVPFVVIVNGTWNVKDKDNIELVYNIGNMKVETGNDINDTDFADMYKLEIADLDQLIANAMSPYKSNYPTAASAATVKNKLTGIFRNIFHEVSRDKFAFTSVEINGNIMNCVYNGSIIGGKKIFDRILAEPAPKKSAKKDANKGLPNYDWLSDRKATYSDVCDLSSEQLRIMRNYIFARHNYIFKSDDLSEYFSQYSWYEPLYSNVTHDLNKTEMANVEFIKKYE